MSRRSLTAVLAGFVCFFFLCAGTPGVRSVGRKHRTDKGRAQLHRRLGPVFATITIGAGWVNDHLRKPLSEPLWPLQKRLGIAQTWALYAGVDHTVRWLVVEVDGTVVYRSNDPDARWLAGPLGSRRMRPVLDKAVMRESTGHWDPLTSFLVGRAARDFPEMQQLRVLAVHQDQATDASPAIAYGRLATAPDWAPIPLGADGQPASGDE